MPTDAISPWLRAHPVFAGDDPERVRDVVGEVISPHVLRTRPRGQQLDARMYAATVGNVTLTHLEYGADVEILALDTADCYCAQFPLADGVRVRSGSESVVASRRVATITSPTDPLAMSWPAEAAHLIVRVERDVVERHLSRLIDGPVREPVRLQLGLDLAGAAGARWKAILDLLQADIARHGDAGGPSAPAWQASSATLDELVMNAMLLWQPSNYSERLAEGARPARAPYVRRAVEHAEANLDGPLTVATLAAAAGVSVRALQAGFARDFGCSPTAWVRDRRLDRIRADLLAGEAADGTRVTDVAVRWGFTHLGRLSHVYRARFGEPPSATLRRAS